MLRTWNLVGWQIVHFWRELVQLQLFLLRYLLPNQYERVIFQVVRFSYLGTLVQFLVQWKTFFTHILTYVFRWQGILPVFHTILPFWHHTDSRYHFETLYWPGCSWTLSLEAISHSQQWWPLLLARAILQEPQLFSMWCSCWVSASHWTSPSWTRLPFIRKSIEHRI